MTEKQNELNDIQNRKEKTIKELNNIEQQIKDENFLIEQAREKINQLSIQTDFPRLCSRITIGNFKKFCGWNFLDKFRRKCSRTTIG